MIYRVYLATEYMPFPRDYPYMVPYEKWIAPETHLLMDTSLDSEETTLIDPVLTMEVSAAGSFEFTIMPTHPEYNNIRVLRDGIWICRDYTPIWYGRPVEMEEDFYRRRKFFCDGILAQLKDGVQPQNKLSARSVGTFFSTYLNYSEDDTWVKWRYDCSATQIDTEFRVTNYDSAWDSIKSKILDRLGGYITVGFWHIPYGDGDNDPVSWGNFKKIAGGRFDCANPVLIYRKDSELTDSGQTIQFGENLLDYVRSENASDIFTDIVPLGKQQEDEFYPNVPIYLTLANDNNYHPENHDSYTVHSQALRDYYGVRITKAVQFEDAETRTELYDAAVEYMAQVESSETISLEVTAIDLSHMDANIDEIEIGTKVRVISEPHNLDIKLVCMKKTIPFFEPDNETITLGTVMAPSISKGTVTGWTDYMRGKFGK